MTEEHFLQAIKKAFLKHFLFKLIVWEVLSCTKVFLVAKQKK